MKQILIINGTHFLTVEDINVWNMLPREMPPTVSPKSFTKEWILFLQRYISWTDTIISLPWKCLRACSCCYCIASVLPQHLRIQVRGHSASPPQSVCETLRENPILSSEGLTFQMYRDTEEKRENITRVNCCCLTYASPCFIILWFGKHPAYSKVCG